VERLWRSIKYEEVYLKAYQSGSEARAGIGVYMDFYNQERLTRLWVTRPRGSVPRRSKEGLYRARKWYYHMEKVMKD
jgi:putative transposase